MNKIIQEPKLWIKKYLIILSTSKSSFPCITKGIKDNKLISNPIQTHNQLEEEIDNKLPIISIKKKK